MGWRYAYCLRKAGYLSAAIQISRKLYDAYPNDKMCRSELLWALYSNDIKQPENGETIDLERALEAANEILTLEPEPFAIHRVAMEISSIAKDLNRWDIVVTFTAYVNALELEEERTSVEGKSIMSEREQWYLMRSRALLETGSPREAETIANLGVTMFPKSKFLARNVALALYQQGNINEAADAYRRLVIRRDADWYFKSELADIEGALGNYEAAYSLLCDALSNPQSEAYKVKGLEKLAEIALALGNLESAAHHVAWTKAIRLHHWGKVPASLTNLEQQINSALQSAGTAWPDVDADPKQLKRFCRSHWEAGKTTGKTYTTGIVYALPDDKDFGFLKRDDTSEDIFVKVRDIPKEVRYVGAKVMFVPERSYDAKKQREGWRARDIQMREA